MSEVELDALLARYPPGIAALAHHCLPRLVDALPCTHRLVYDYGTHLVVGLGRSERGNEAIVALAIHPDRVQLYFDKSIPDPRRRLQGKGGKVRSVALASPGDFDDADVQALVAAAARQAGVDRPPAGAIRTIIKPGAKAKKPG